MIQPFDFAIFLSRAPKIFLSIFLTLTILTSSVFSAVAADSQDSQLFISGFNAYQKGDYAAAVSRMNQVLTKHPETPLRDMALFWLARAHFKAGNQHEAARYLSQFNKEYPDSPLKGTIEEELAALAPRYERGEQLPNAAEQTAKPVAPPVDAERIAAEQAALAKAAVEKEAAEKIAAAQATAEKAAKEKAETERIAAEQLAAAKAAEERAKAEKAEIARNVETRAAEQIAAAKAAADKATAERQALEAAAAAKLAAAKAEADKAAAERAAIEKSTQEKLAAAKAETERIAAERAASEKNAQEKLATALAAEKTLREQLMAEKTARQQAEADRAKTEKLAQEQIAAAKTDAERQAKTVMAQEQAARDQAAAEQRSAREKLLESSLAAEKAAREKADAEKAAAEKAAAEQLAEVQATLAKLETERAAAKKAAQANVDAAVVNEKLARENAEAQRVAAEKAAAEQVAAAKVAIEQAQAELARERAAREKAEADRLAAEKVAKAAVTAPVAPLSPPTVELKPTVQVENTQLAAERAAREQAEAALAQERTAREKADADRVKAEQRAAELLATRVESAPAKAAEAIVPSQAIVKSAKTTRASREKSRENAQLREKAVAEYKRIVDRFPGSKAAASATAKLKELGISYGAVATEPAEATMTSTARVLAFEVGQYASLELTGQPAATVAQTGSRALIPFEVVNTGNGPDTFLLSTTTASDLKPVFAAAADPETAIQATPPLAPGERFKGVVSLTVPHKSIDGERLAFPMRATSQFIADVSQSRELRIVSSAPLLRAVIKADKAQLLPGEIVTYKISLLNVGSAPGRDLSFRIVHPAQLLPTGDTPEMRRDSATSLVQEALNLQSGESRELTLRFQLAADALAQQELFVQGEFSNPFLKKRDSFLAQAVTVQTVRGITATTATGKIVVTPGQKVAIPIVVTNTGNVREDYSLAAAIPAALSYAIYQDQNRDGLKQAGEPVINHVGPLAPREVAHVLLELATASSATDGSSIPVAISFISDADRTKSARVDFNLSHTRPVLDLTVNGKGGKIRPGEASTVELDCVNRGTSLAKVVEIESILPEQLELVAADPAFTRGEKGRYLWSFEELGANEKRSIKITYRIKSGTALGTSIQLKNQLSYQDLQGNRY